MGSKKIYSAERIKEGAEVGREAVARGGEITGEGGEIKSLLDGMERDIDEDDVPILDIAESGYKEDFDVTFTNEADTQALKAETIEREAHEMAEREKEKVEYNREKFVETKAVTDIGRENAEHGIEAMEDSSAEYKEFMERAEEISDELSEDINQLRNVMDRIFG